MSSTEDLSWLEDIELDQFFRMVDAFMRVDIVDLAARISPDHIALALLAHNLRYAKQLVADAGAYVEEELIKAMPHKVEVIEGIGEVQYHTGAKRSEWDREGLIAAATQAIGADPEFPVLVEPASGEMIDTVRLVRMVLDAFTAMATPSWKVTGLRPAGINPDDYCHTSWGRKTIEMPKPEGFIPLDEGSN